MAVQPRKNRVPVVLRTRKSSITISVRIAVTANAKLSACAALAGIDKSAYVARLIEADISGLVLADKRKSGQVVTHDDAGEGIGEDVAA